MGIVVHKIRVKKVKKAGNAEGSALLKQRRDDDVDYLRGLTRKILFETENRGRSKEETLPPLTTSNEVDAKLYALFALLLKNFVFGWYTESLQLGGRDEFTREIVYLFAHVCRGIQERAIAGQDDLVGMVVVDLPLLVRRHLKRIEEVRLDPAVDEEEMEDVWLQRYGRGLGDEETIIQYRRVLVRGIVQQLFPYEVLNSSVSREFIVSLIDGVAVRSVTESMCDNFALWEIMGKIADVVVRSGEGEKEKEKEKEKEGEKGDYNILSRLHRLLEFFVVDPRYEVRNSEKLLSYVHLMPMFALVEYMTNFVRRFPLIAGFLHVIGSVLMRFRIVREFVNACLKRFVYERILCAKNICAGIDALRHMLFPWDDLFAPEPRYVPATAEELAAVRKRNEEKLSLLLTSSVLKRVFVDSAESSEDVERKITRVMESVKYRRINAVFIQELLDLLVCRIFPELQEVEIMTDTGREF